MAATTVTPSAPTRSLRKVLLTRASVFSLFFILIGVWMLLSAPSSFTAATLTRLTLGEGGGVLDIPTQLYATLAGALYVLIGILGGVGQFVPAAHRPAGWGLLLGGLLLVPTALVLAVAGKNLNVVTLASISLRTATPVVLGALAGIWCERSGVVNIGIEGMMLTGACFGFVVYALMGPALGTANAQLAGLVVAVLCGGLIALLHAWLSITFKTDQIVSGTVINIMALGLTSFMRREVLLTLAETGRDTFPTVQIPLLADIPIVGEILFQGQPIFYGMFVLLGVSTLVLYYTRWGLRTRAVGENPHAADTLGINVPRVRWVNVFVGGLIAGLAGAWFSLETVGRFEDAMTNGRGFIALAAMIFGNWTPFGAFAGGLLYGFADILGNTFQSYIPIPAQFLQMVPYVITIVVLAGLVGRAQPPKAAGKPYDKEGK